MEKLKFPIIKVGYIFNKLNAKVNIPIILNKQEVKIEYPCRLDAMAYLSVFERLYSNRYHMS